MSDLDTALVRQLHPEVTKLHPWLHKLLDRLPDVPSVEYTHGTHEYGADFVIERTDSVLKKTSTVGLVVKSGTIKQNDPDVRRQINECFGIERNSIKEVRKKTVGEVWVVASGSITGGARESLIAEFKGRAVTFLCDSDLASMARENAPYLLDNIPSEVSVHNAELRDSVIKESQRYNLLSSSTTVPYIPQKLHAIDSLYSESKNPFPKIVASLEDVLDNALASSVIVVEGEPGSGRSTMLRRCIERLCSKDMYLRKSLIPIRVKIVEPICTVTEAVTQVTEQLHACTTGDALPNDRLAIFIDDLEHCVNESPERIRWIEEFTECVKGSIDGRRFLVVFATSDLGPSAIQITSRFQRFELQDPTVGDIIRFIKDACKSTPLPPKVLHDIQSSPLFQEIRSKPAAAVLLADLLRSNDKADLPTHLTELYDRYAELALGRWLPDGGVQSTNYYKAAQGILLCLANQLVSSSSIELSFSAYTQFIETYIEERKLSVDSAKLAHWLQESNLLAHDQESGMVFFRNRMIRDFFSAKYLFGRLDNQELADGILEYELSTQWFFYFGLKLDCPSELRMAIDSKAIDHDSQLLKVMLVPQLLLAANQTEYSTTEAAIQSLLLEAAHLYIAVRKNPEGSAKPRYSEMDLLWWFQHTLRAYYGMVHFKDAVQKALAAISETAGEEAQQYSAFFLSVIAMDLGIPNSLDQLIKVLGDNSQLPTPLMLAIRHEATFDNQKSKRISKILRRLKRFESPAIGHSSPFRELYQVRLVDRHSSQTKPAE